MSEGANLIQIFARAPVLGQTKRRLASELGEGAALHWYRVLLARTLATVRQLPDVTIEVWHPVEDDDYPLMELINDASVGLYPQASGDLGQKMSNALEVGLTRSERVLLIGADCPVWTTSLLRQAIDGISSASALFVPAADGGYVGVGVSGSVPHLFTDIDWGTGRVMEQTRERASEQGVSLTEMAPLWDVDVAADLNRWLAMEPHLPRPIA